MGKAIHRLSEINTETGYGVCSACGSVKLRKKQKGWRCSYSEQYGSLAALNVVKPKQGTCELCDAEVKVFFDHNHKTGAHRGWLCRHCNLMLGFARDNPETLKRASTYLLR